MKTANLNPDRSKIYIVAAANRFQSDGLIITSVRHYDLLMHAVIAALGRTRESMDQGFVDNRRNFLTRTEAWKVAEAAGQIRYRCGGDDRDDGTLYSENLY